MTEAELREAYELRKPKLQAFGEWVTGLILTRLKQQLGSESAVEKFLQIPPRPRVKDTDSFLEKALIRKPKHNPLHEVTDQVGVRFVVLLLEDIDRVGQIVQSSDWHWQKDRDHEQERLEKPDYFAYQSDHYIVRSKKQLTWNEITIPENIACEIQIRTILQHAYAEMAHISDYKPSIRLPEESQKLVKRSLAKGSALIETTDDVFREIQDRLRQYSASINALLVRSSEIYLKLTGEAASPSTPMGELIADTYRDLLENLTPEQLHAWADDYPWLGKELSKRRYESVFYRDSVMILLGWLVSRHRMTIPRYWPLEMRYLEDFYTMLGLSTNNLF